MSNVLIRKLLDKDRTRVIGGIIGAINTPIGVFDANHQLLLGTIEQNRTNPELSPIQVDGNVIGWVSGGTLLEQAGIANLISYLLEQEAEKKDLANEVLDRYRELNLLYRLSTHLMTSPQPEMIATMVLDEVCPLIRAAHGAVLLVNGPDEPMSLLAECGVEWVGEPGATDPGEVVPRVLQTGVAELSHNLPSGNLYAGMENASVSLLCAPLKTEKGIIGVIVMVGHQPEQFTAGDLKLLSAIAMQTAPAIEIARLHQVSLQNARLERDLQMARKVQADLLPKRNPDLPGWYFAAHWQPARIVSGDFYDFIWLTDGRLGIVVGDVTDKGMPAALVMANTRSILRAVISSTGRKGQVSPGKLLAKANDLLCADMPQHMYVTCFLAVLDPMTGHLTFANAGHPLPFHIQKNGLRTLCARGLPLGIFLRSKYEEDEVELFPGDRLLLFSDGLIEAHSPKGNMFEMDAVRSVLERAGQTPAVDGNGLIKMLIDRLGQFTGPGWEQEDDVTLVYLERKNFT